MQEGSNESPVGIVDAIAKQKIEADELDDKDTIVTGVVNSFNRSSKTGIIFSEYYGRGFRFEYSSDEKLGRQDDFSWSQYTGKSIRLNGKFVLFFDGKIKKFLVYHVERVPETDF
ncbi:MAG: hypothetical protein HC850_13450 [Rhodomicrobium sp.]|nr:hypothetical protein [Rhodomicrobium sp.]